MATKEVKSAIIHSNGETQTVEGHEATKRLINGFPGMPMAKVSDTKAYVFGMTDGSAFLEITPGDSDFKLDEKPNCNNFLDCDKPEEKPEAKPDEKPKQ